MSNDEKPVVQVVPASPTASSTPPRTIAPQQPADLAAPRLETIDDVESTRTLTPTTLTPTASNTQTPHQEPHTNPCSPFYCHPTTRTSFDLQKTECKPFVNVYDVDVEKLENGRPKKCCRGISGRSSWGGKKSNGDKNPFKCNKRHWRPLKGMPARKKLLIKLLIAIITIAAAVSIGICVSKAVGAGVWKSNSQVRPIGNGNGVNRL